MLAIVRMLRMSATRTRISPRSSCFNARRLSSWANRESAKEALARREEPLPRPHQVREGADRDRIQPPDLGGEGPNLVGPVTALDRVELAREPRHGHKPSGDL